jgi:hypothetical protein
MNCLPLHESGYNIYIGPKAQPTRLLSLIVVTKIGYKSYHLYL